MENGCIKTGCHVYSEEYREYLYGDAFHHNGTLIIRVCQRKREPISTGVPLHFTVKCITEWWDKSFTSTERNSTLISQDFEYHGYDGVKV